jgi:hypothetical protein
MALSFLILSFYYGLVCGGGFSQINYLGDMRQAYLNLLNDVEAEESEKDLARSIKTNLFRGEFVLATLETFKERVPASGLDLALYGNERTAERLEEMGRNFSLRDAVATMMPEYHKIITGYYPTSNKPLLPEPSLSAIESPSI